MDVKTIVCLWIMIYGFHIIDAIKQRLYMEWKTKPLRDKIQKEIEVMFNEKTIR